MFIFKALFTALTFIMPLTLGFFTHLLLRNTHLRNDSVFFSLLIGIISFILSLFLSNFCIEKLESKHLDKVIPENVGLRSYIDTETSEIFLLSDDYHLYREKKWIVYDEDVSTVAIVENFNDKTRGSFHHTSDVNNVKLDSNTNSLSFSIFETYFESKDGGEGPLVKKITSDELYIFFKDEDFEIAKSVRRILSKKK
jgi:uncharacterized membrane protein (DUF485 family)